MAIFYIEQNAAPTGIWSTAMAVVCNDLKIHYRKLFKEHLKVSSKDIHTLFIYLPFPFYCYILF